jgi:hypothetical protein
MTTATAVEVKEGTDYSKVPLLRVRGLSLTRPWPWAFVNGPFPKRIENRSWPPPLSVTRTHYIALHAAKSWDEEDREFIEDITGIAVPPRDEHPDSNIFAVCRVPTYIDIENGALTSSALKQDQRRWFFGPYGWIIADFVSLVEPVFCKGAQGLWSFEHKQSGLADLRRVYALSIIHNQK